MPRTERERRDLGRWRIEGARPHPSGTYMQAVGEDLPTGTLVPVVPCDDAAVERAIKALEDAAPIYAREAVETVLRAAGETP